MGGRRPARSACAQNRRKCSSERAEDSKARLLGGLRALQEADDRLKGGKDARTVLEFLVSELTAAEAQAARG